MKMTHLLILALCLAVAGCGSDGIVRSPPTSVRFINAASHYGALNFQREQNIEVQFQYTGGGTARWDSGPYDFKVQRVLPRSSFAIDEYFFSLNLSPSRDYTFIVTNPDDAIDVLVVETPDTRVGDAASRYTIAHANPQQDPINVYLAPEGSVPGLLAPNATITYGPDASTFEVTPGTYHLYLTPADNPDDILFESTNVEAVAKDNNMLVVADPGGIGTLDIDVIDATVFPFARLFQLNVGNELRAIQGIDDRMPRDLLLDDDTTPLFEDLVFGEMTDTVPVSADSHVLKVTPPNAPGSDEASASFAAQQGRYFLAIISGNSTDGIEATVVTENRRKIIGQASLSILNAAGLFDPVVIYLAAPETDITTVQPNFLSQPPQFFNHIAVPPGDFEVTIQDPFTSTTLAGPVSITMEDGGLYGITLLNNADNSGIDVGFLYDFVP